MAPCYNVKTGRGFYAIGGLGAHARLYVYGYMFIQKVYSRGARLAERGAKGDRAAVAHGTRGWRVQGRDIQGGRR